MHWTLSYQIIRSKRRRKTMSLRIREDGRIFVYVPSKTPQEAVERFIEKSASWISQKQSDREQWIERTKKRYREGESFFYLGEAYPLSVDTDGGGKEPLRLSFGKFILDGRRAHEAKEIFARWYAAEANRTLKERIDYYSDRLKLFPKSFRITNARIHWGSCSVDDRLCISWRIMMAPLDVVDYILIHELVHIREKNHSSRFWNYLESILPDYRRRRSWLKQHERLFCL